MVHWCHIYGLITVTGEHAFCGESAIEIERIWGTRDGTTQIISTVSVVPPGLASKGGSVPGAEAPGYCRAPLRGSRRASFQNIVVCSSGIFRTFLRAIVGRPSGASLGGSC